jgi:2-methylcitrate dehydratase PrpD
VNGAFAHAFEQDSLRKPGAGVHPGATLLPPALAMTQELNTSGEKLLRGFIAACEVMFRIGSASKHSSEKLGFHAPGLTGVYGASLASGIVQGLDPRKLSNALGIAGSLSSGLLAFTKSERGAEVKRLHLGKACESGVQASRLAYEGFEGPESILEGQFGFLHSFCSDRDPDLLTKGLGSVWETSKICMKTYPCHITAHPLIYALLEMMKEFNFSAKDISTCHLTVPEKVLSHHDIRQPKDIKQAQYSVPFCLAIAMNHDVLNPNVFTDAITKDVQVLENCKKITMSAYNDQIKRSSWTSNIAITLTNGQSYSRESDYFIGSPDNPLTLAQLSNRFQNHTQNCDPEQAHQWLKAFLDIEHCPSLLDLPSLS